MDLNTNKIKTALNELGIIFSESQVSCIKAYLDELYNYNQKLNLVGTRDKEEILIRHIFDSLSILAYSDKLMGDNVNKIIDIGTGAGLPGFALAIFLKDKEFYLLDKTQKKIDFLKETANVLGVMNALMMRGRAEEIARDKKYRESFDLVIARAVTKFNILAELTIPFCRINGKIIFYKSKKIFAELKENRNMLEKLGGEVQDLLEIKVPYLEEFRSFLIVKKKSGTPVKYPRRFSKILKEKL